MELDLNRDDLLPEHKDIACRDTAFKHFQPIAQAVIILVGEAMFRSRDSYNKIYPPKKKKSEKQDTYTKYEVDKDTKLRLVYNGDHPRYQVTTNRPTEAVKAFCRTIENWKPEAVMVINDIAMKMKLDVKLAIELARQSIYGGFVVTANEMVTRNK